jgi:hypothetical protein
MAEGSNPQIPDLAVAVSLFVRYRRTLVDLRQRKIGCPQFGFAALYFFNYVLKRVKPALLLLDERNPCTCIPIVFWLVSQASRP